jgi:nucleotidyltransferase substrate binding protein (TIGR01987 family)
MSDRPSLDHFGNALSKLREFTAAPIVDDRDRAGIIQAFEFTFEQCWKAFQRIAAAQGITVASPRQSLEAAVRLQLIRREDEDAWLEMLHDRNLTSHLYHETTAREVTDRIVDRYLNLLSESHQRCV